MGQPAPALPGKAARPPGRDVRVNVRIFPDCNDRHVLQVYAGLYDLHAAGVIRLKLADRLADAPREFTSHTVWVEFDDPRDGRVVRLCFDMQDGGEIASSDALERCDLYFKRSYSATCTRELPARLAQKVQPYGLNYACVSRHEPTMLLRLFKEWGLWRAGYMTSLRADPAAFRRALQLALVQTAAQGSRLCPYLRAETFEVPPDHPAEPKILLQTRLWHGVNGPDEWEEMNELRAGMVRSLRKAFGDRFVGGLEDTPLARERYPELISRLSCQKLDYVRLVRRHLIGVTSTGLFDSIGWKLPEYLAASRCIVSEPLRYRLPVPLEIGVNYIPVFSPEGAVSACERLLSDRELASEMRHANFKYYRDHVRPRSLMRNCLRVALRHVARRRAGSAMPVKRAERREEVFVRS